MHPRTSLLVAIKKELLLFFVPPRQFLNTIAINSVVSLLFFLVSYYLGMYNPQLLPVAAATILLWTLADSSITNQLIFDKKSTVNAMKKDGTLKRLLMAKNLTVVILSIPLTLVYGLILVVIVGKWDVIIYGVIMAFTLIWGWLGVCNALSVLLPFKVINFKKIFGNRHMWLRYSILYGLPWLMLPVYAIVMSLPFILVGWTRADAAISHRLIAVMILFLSSMLIWQIGLLLADRYARRPHSRIKKVILEK